MGWTSPPGARVLREIAAQPVPDPAVIVEGMAAPSTEKFDGYLTEPLGRTELKVRDLDVDGAHRTVRAIVGT